MTPQPSQTPRTAPVDNTNKTALGKAKAEVKDALARVKAEEKARNKAEDALSACQEDVKALQAELDRERQLRSKIERELAEAQSTISSQTPSAESVDDNSDDKQAETTENVDTNPENVKSQDRSQLTQSTQITIMSLQLFTQDGHSVFNNQSKFQDNIDKIALKVRSIDRMILELRFKIRGPDAAKLADSETPFEIEVYARNILGNASRLWSSHHSRLERNTFEYIVTLQLPEQPAGLNRLTVLVKSTHMIDHRNGPVFLVE